MDRKGVLGLDTVKVVMITFLVLAVIGVALVLSLTNIRDVAETIDLVRGTINNETLTTVTETGEDFDKNSERVCSASGLSVTNASDAWLIASGNYTQTGCNLAVSSTVDLGLNNTNWNVTYTYVHASSRAYNIQTNVSTGTSSFFTNTTTIFTILFVVVIILAIAIIIAVVSGFGREGRGIGGRIGLGGRARGPGTVMGI